jgi:hypothetical protein
MLAAVCLVGCSRDPLHVCAFGYPLAELISGRKPERKARCAYPLAMPESSTEDDQDGSTESRKGSFKGRSEGLYGGSLPS